MSELLREEEVYWLYMNGNPYKRSSREPSHTDVYKLQAKYPTAMFTVKKEERRVTELRSFAPLHRDDKYRN